MFRTLFALISGISLSLWIGSQTFAQSDVYYATHHDYRVKTVVEGLIQPWSIAWLPNGDMLITEKPGRLRIFRNGELLPDPVHGVPEVFYQGQGGLFEVLPHPEFESNQLIYLSFSKPVGDGSTTAIVRGRLESNRLLNVMEIFSARTSGAGHYGGKMVFDNNGYLFLTVGARQTPSTGDLMTHPAQDLRNHHGVIVRLRDDGSVPDDNPFVSRTNALPEIWSYGHRNPQGLAFHSETGDLWESEHGPLGGDEINLIEAGANYGWPVIGRGLNYGTGSPIHSGISQLGMEQPEHFWVPGIATSGLMIYTGNRFPLWHGSIFSGGLAGQQLARLTMSDDYKQIILEETLAYGLGRIRDVRQGPDGYVYLAIDDSNGEPTPIVRLEPVN